MSRSAMNEKAKFIVSFIFNLSVSLPLALAYAGASLIYEGLYPEPTRDYVRLLNEMALVFVVCLAVSWLLANTTWGISNHVNGFVAVAATLRRSLSRKTLIFLSVAFALATLCGAALEILRQTALVASGALLLGFGLGLPAQVFASYFILKGHNDGI